MIEYNFSEILPYLSVGGFLNAVISSFLGGGGGAPIIGGAGTGTPTPQPTGTNTSLPTMSSLNSLMNATPIGSLRRYGMEKFDEMLWGDEESKATKRGKADRKYLDQLLPGVTPWELAGSPASAGGQGGRGLVGHQKDMQSRSLSLDKYKADLAAETAVKVAEIGQGGTREQARQYDTTGAELQRKQTGALRAKIEITEYEKDKIYEETRNLEQQREVIRETANLIEQQKYLTEGQLNRIRAEVKVMAQEMELRAQEIDIKTIEAEYAEALIWSRILGQGGMVIGRLGFLKAFLGQNKKAQRFINDMERLFKTKKKFGNFKGPHEPNSQFGKKKFGGESSSIPNPKGPHKAPPMQSRRKKLPPHNE